MKKNEKKNPLYYGQFIVLKAKIIGEQNLRFLLPRPILPSIGKNKKNKNPI